MIRKCCACRIETIDSVPVNAKRQASTLAEMLRHLVPIQFSAIVEDGGEVICADCVEHTVDAYRFVELVCMANEERDQQADSVNFPLPVDIPFSTGTVELTIEHTENLNDLQYFFPHGIEELIEEEAICKESLMSDSSAPTDADDESQDLSEPDDQNNNTSNVGGLLHVNYYPILASGNAYYRCCGRKCWQTFDSREELEKHGAQSHTGSHSSRTHYDDSYCYECNICYRRFQRRSNLITHLRRAVRDYECTLCKVVFDRPKDREQHMITEHQSYVHAKRRKRYELEQQPHKTCCGCGARFNTVAELLEHGTATHAAHPLRQESNGYELQCEVCYRYFKHRTGLRNHQTAVYREKRLSCNQCGAVFSCTSKLVSHEQTHAVDRGFVCEQCGKAFKTPAALRAHGQIHQERTLQCDICNHRVHKKSQLVQHLKRHEAELPIACALCPKRFRYQSNLVSHMRVHTGEKSYGCRYCDRRFGYVSDRLKHERSHTGDYPYSCEVCGKKFVRPSSLQMHEASCRV
ncbi:zinc finger protein 436-like [Anopheles albimanus]|uniref:C2H2-type domain-containing protein n=1 Tax=Anopheles albimanus TaxID=7167 RepID=A0A182FWI2_ANOAL|nr:zinc finger protein 436-like [Anopheles albimanus]